MAMVLEVKRGGLTVAIDCGRVINPSGAANQITGGLIWGLTALCSMVARQLRTVTSCTATSVRTSCSE